METRVSFRYKRVSLSKFGDLYPHVGRRNVEHCNIRRSVLSFCIKSYFLFSFKTGHTNDELISVMCKHDI